MAGWYSKISADPDNHELLLTALADLDKQYDEAAKELRTIRGVKLVEWSARIPGMMEWCYSTFQELEAIKSFYERSEEVVRITAKKNFLDHYNKVLTDRQADQYATVVPEVQVIRELIEMVNLTRQKYAALSKGYDALQFQITNVRALRVEGIEDATF